MNRLVARTVVIALLATLLGGHAAALCAMSAPAPSGLPLCHHRVPAAPHPADHHPANHRCCVGQSPSALPSTVFPSTFAFQAALTDQIAASVPISLRNIALPEITVSFSPPAAITLKI